MEKTNRTDGQTAYLQGDVKIEQSHGQVIRNQSPAERKGLPAGHHPFAAVVDGHEIGQSDEQRRGRRRHEGPLSHPRICVPNNIGPSMIKLGTLNNYYLPGSCTTGRTGWHAGRLSRRNRWIRNTSGWWTSPSWIASSTLLMLDRSIKSNGDQRGLAGGAEPPLRRLYCCAQPHCCCSCGALPLPVDYENFSNSKRDKQDNFFLAWNIFLDCITWRW